MRARPLPRTAADSGVVAPENVFLDAITTHSDSDAVPIDAVIAWFDNVKKVPRLKQRTMAVVPAIERPLVAGKPQHRVDCPRASQSWAPVWILLQQAH